MSAARFYILLLTGFVGVILMGALVKIALDVSDELLGEDEKVPRTKVYRRTLAEGGRLSQHGYFGIDFVRFSSARVEKVRKGVFTFGGLNRLVFDDLSVVLPNEDSADKKVSSEESASRGSARQLARRLGVSNGFLKGQGLPVKFSGLLINRFDLSRLDAATNVIHVLSAERGEACASGLNLRNCTIVENNSSNRVQEALLTLKPKFQIVWPTGKLDL